MKITSYEHKTESDGSEWIALHADNGVTIHLLKETITEIFENLGYLLVSPEVREEMKYAIVEKAYMDFGFVKEKYAKLEITIPCQANEFFNLLDRLVTQQ